MTASQREQYMQGCRSGDLEMVKVNVGQVRVNYQDEQGMTGLMWSIAGGHNGVSKYLLSLPNIDINIKDNLSRTALYVHKLILEEARLKADNIRQEAKVKADHAQAEKDNEAKKFVQDIKSAYTLDNLHDLTLICQGEKIPCHAVILASRSTEFEAMLQHNMVEKQTMEIHIQDASPMMVRVMIKHIYTGEIPEDINEVASDVIHVADKYHLANLKKVCVKVLMKQLNNFNALNTFILIDKYAPMSALKEDVIMFIWDNYATIFGTEEWMDFLKSYPNLATELCSFKGKLHKFKD